MRAWLSMAVALIALFGVAVAAEEFEAGVHYEVLPIPVDTAAADKIEVVEIFSYGCPACFGFDPILESWRANQANDVLFRRMPAMVREDWVMYAQAFYAAEALGVLDKMHTPMFEALHMRGLDLRDPKVLAGVFKDSAGINEDEFVRVLNSFGVRSKTMQADAQGRMYRITGVPTIVVDGKYRVYGGMLDGSNIRVLAVVDFLISMIREQSKSG